MLPDSLHFIERDWLSANHLLAFDGDGAAIIDTGYVKHAATTLALVQHALAMRGHVPLTRIFNTHLHSDHCGGNALLKASFNAEITVNDAEWNTVVQWNPDTLSFVATGQRCDPFTPDHRAQAGEVHRFGGLRWEVLAAPGHDPHSFMLYQPEHQVLVSADALWENGFGVTFPELIGQSGFAEQAQVLDLLTSLPIKCVIPGHGPMFTDVQGALGRARARINAMTEDPQRNVRLVLKVLVKFALLDQERLFLPELATQFSSAHYLAGASTLMGVPLQQALEWAVEDLQRQGQVSREGDWVVNAY